MQFLCSIHSKRDIKGHKTLSCPLTAKQVLIRIYKGIEKRRDYKFHLDTEEVRGSIPLVPTIFLGFLW